MARAQATRSAADVCRREEARRAAARPRSAFTWHCLLNRSNLVRVSPYFLTVDELVELHVRDGRLSQVGRIYEVDSFRGDLMDYAGDLEAI